MVEPKSVVYHVGGGTLQVGSPLKTHLNFRNNLYMLFKNLPLSSLFIIIPIRLVLDGIAAITFLPFDALKHGKYSGICNLNIRLLDAFLNMSINKMSKVNPTQAINHPNWKMGKKYL